MRKSPDDSPAIDEDVIRIIAPLFRFSRPVRLPTVGPDKDVEVRIETVEDIDREFIQDTRRVARTGRHTQPTHAPGELDDSQ